MFFKPPIRFDFSQPQDSSTNERLIRGLLFSKALSVARKHFLNHEIDVCDHDGGCHRFIVTMSCERLAEFVYYLSLNLTEMQTESIVEYFCPKLEGGFSNPLLVVDYLEAYKRLKASGKIQEEEFFHVRGIQQGLQECVGKITVSRRFYDCKEYRDTAHRLLAKAEYNKWVTSLLKHV